MNFRKFLVQSPIAIVVVFAFFALPNFAEAADTMKIHIPEPKTFKLNVDAEALRQYASDFLSRDKRYTVVKKPSEDVKREIQITLTPRGKTIEFSLSHHTAGDKNEENVKAFVSELPSRLATVQIETEIAKGIREVLDFKPEKYKMLVAIHGSAAEGEIDGAMIQDAIVQALKNEFESIPPDPYKFPIGEKNIPKLYKGDKKLLAEIRKKGNADYLFAGTVHMPKTKDIGGAQANLYEGKAVVRIKGWDLKRRKIVSEVKMDLNGKGIYSELLYTLFEAAAKKSASQVKMDMGFPVEEKDESTKEDSEE